MLKLRPPKGKLIVKVQAEESVTKSGIILASEATENPHDTIKAQVISVGFDCRKFVKAKDYILYEQCYSRPCIIDGEVCKVINFEDILGVIVDEQ